MATREYGYIKAKNKDTGVIYEIRPDMLKIQGNPWILLDEDDNPVDTSPEVENLSKKVKVEEPTVVLTKENKPFKTEQSARVQMKKQGLSEHEWIVLSDGQEGFIITKV